MDLGLKVGEYSYKEMCELFHEKPKTGKSKQLQLKHWELYCRYERPTNRLFVVNEVYEEPLARVDGRKTNGRKSETEEEFFHPIWVTVRSRIYAKYVPYSKWTVADGKTDQWRAF